MQISKLFQLLSRARKGARSLAKAVVWKLGNLRLGARSSARISICRRGGVVRLHRFSPCAGHEKGRGSDPFQDGAPAFGFTGLETRYALGHGSSFAALFAAAVLAMFAFLRMCLRRVLRAELGPAHRITKSAGRHNSPQRVRLSGGDNNRGQVNGRLPRLGAGARIARSILGREADVKPGQLLAGRHRQERARGENPRSFRCPDRCETLS